MERAPSQQESSDGFEELLVGGVKKRRLKVEQLERELDDLNKQISRLVRMHSVPVFPHGAAVPGKEEEEGDHHRLGAGGFPSAQAPDAAGVLNSIPTENLSSSSDEDRAAINTKDVDALKDEIRRERPAANGVKKPSPAKPNNVNFTRDSEKLESSDDESESSDEESLNHDGSEVPEASDDYESEEAVEASDDSSGSDSDSSMEPMKKPSPVKSPGKVKRPVVRKPEIRVSSSGSEESSSSSDDEDDAGIQRQTGRASLGRAKEPQVPKPVSATSLLPNASPEDLFDWLILSFQGPWAPPASIEDSSSGASELKHQALPLKFSSFAAYPAMFQKLIGEEAKAILSSEWDEYKKEQELNAESSVDSRGQSTVWQVRSMVQTIGDPFHYFEAECIEGQKQKFEAGEFLCMIVPGTAEVKAVAIVNSQDRFQALLKTRVPWGSPLNKCVLLRLCNMVTLRRMFLAVSTLSEMYSPLQQQILNPLANKKFLKPLDDDPNHELSSESLRNFSNRKILNSLQLLTVSSLLHMRQGFQLVQGPPGTGKTSTIVGMVSTLLIEEPGARILVCAPSNAALDELAARLKDQMLDKSGNTFSPIDGSIVRFGVQKAMHPRVQLLSLDSLSARLSSSSHRSRAWVDILDAASVVCATLSGCGHTTFDELERMFDVVIIDEAAQAVEAEVLIALRRVKGRCVMVGDPQQLPATVFQQPSTAYSRSLFERFQEGGVPVHILKTQYRMHPSICSYPSRKFYEGALQHSLRTSSMQSIFSSEVSTKGITIRGCRFKLNHYTFMDVGWSIEKEELVGHSRANYEEALVVCNVVEGAVKGLLSGRKPNVGVITPYSAQRGLIERELDKRGIDSSACEVNTVDGFQGREKDVIVLSCVRAKPDKEGLGFVSNERRMNVALTRAKYALIIVGHAETLQKRSPAWGGLIEDARKRGCYQVLANNKSPHIPSRNRKAISSPQMETAEVEDTELTTVDKKSTKNVKGKAKKDENDTQKARDEETKVKRKRKSLDVEGGDNKASPTVKKKKRRKATESSPDLSKKKKKMKQKKKIEVDEDVPESSEKKRKKKPKVNEDVPGSSEKKRKKKTKVDGDVTESAEKRRKKSPKVEGSDVVERKGKQEKVKEPEQELPSEKKRQWKAVICLPAPAINRKGDNRTAEAPVLKKEVDNTTAEAAVFNRKVGDNTVETPGFDRKGDNTTAEAPGFSRKGDEAVQLKAPKVEVPEPESSTRARIVEAPLKATVKQEEGVTSAAPENIPQVPVMNSIPQERDRNAATEKPSRAWFQNSVPEPDRHSPHNHQLPPTSVLPGFGRFDEHGVGSTRQPPQAHWGNSYEVPHEADMTTDKLNSVLSRANHYLMQPNHFQQEPRNHWQHPNAAHMVNQFGAHHHHFQSADHRHHQPPRPGPQFNGGSNSHSSLHWRGRGGRRGGRHPYPGR